MIEIDISPDISAGEFQELLIDLHKFLLDDKRRYMIKNIEVNLYTSIGGEK